MDRYLSANEIMTATGLSKNVVYSMFKIPSFPAIKIGKRILVSERAFEEWMNRGGTEQRAG